ncbi:endonuclease/exonuclease/phosphatase family protein [Methanobrevibacter thaueri]|uniref:Endonuclease/exonuclease/phosphatase family protein n=1 Tax=Methanobrevibacter thaueri TaxID=190975 RepID=A0A315XN47_9EURY|nr:endonuclease/exonuclease/phosphatase family protein [Methanobrevibacter thaueri]PWB87294.1 endonuclease/exonuclease/phosphatase family protein [Methanobrevibacter thaueri]
MKIVTWNANGKFSEKFPAILEENADIYVIQECENPEIVNSKKYSEFASNYYWVGENQYYGLGIFAKDNIKLKLIELDDKGLRYFIPVTVNDAFNLLGIWTNPNMEGSKVLHYPKEITKYYDEHKDSGFFNEDMIICGDFNCDVRLADKRHGKNVLEMAERLSEKGLVDTYHYLNCELQGEESIATFYWYRKLDKPFHLDHVFSSPDKVKDLQIGDADKWLELSDHMPLTFEI